MKILIIPLLIVTVAHGQMVNNGAQITIDNTALSVDDDMLNIGNIQNNGDLIIYQNWMNVGVYESPNGTLILAGDDQQIMNNGQTLQDLELRNGSKTISDDLVIEGELTFNEFAFLDITEEAKLTLGQDVLITGAGPNAYIRGKLYRTGTGDLFFPIGSGEAYLPVTLVDVIGLDPEVALTAVSESPDQGIGGDLEELFGQQYWILESDQNYQASFINIHISNDSTLDTANLVVAQAVSETASFNTLGRSTIQYDGENGDITSQGNAIGPYFTVAIAPEVPPLPTLRVINALTPFQDGRHDFLRIENIELYPDNQVEIFDRSGIKVFSISNYDNRERVFRGVPNQGAISELQDGNYYYTIKTGRTKVKAGFLFIKQ